MKNFNLTEYKNFKNNLKSFITQELDLIVKKIPKEQFNSLFGAKGKKIQSALKTQNIKTIKGVFEFVNDIYKIELNNEYQLPTVDRILNKSFKHYYGEIPNTIAEDGDALDLIGIKIDQQIEFKTPCITEVIPFITLDIKDDDELDYKVISLPIVNLFSFIAFNNNLSDEIIEIINFFLNQSNLNRKIEIENIIGLEETLKIIDNAYNKNE